tara:strand:+ start:1177 stop:1554 length:378 start_codon:yes stop_codon:yes gene_type:complete
MEDKKVKNGNPLVAAIANWIKVHPKQSFLIMAFLLGFGFLFHINEGYVNKEKIVFETARGSQEDIIIKYKKEVEGGGVHKDMSNIIELMKAEDELKQLLRDENIDTLKLRELEDKIKNIENNGKH